MELKEDGYIVLSTGYNGDAKFALLTQEKRVTVIDFTDPASFALKLVEKFPFIAEQIDRYHQCDNLSDLPKDVDITKLEPSKIIIIVSVVSGVFRSKKEKVKS